MFWDRVLLGLMESDVRNSPVCVCSHIVFSGVYLLRCVLSVEQQQGHTFACPMVHGG